MTDSEQKVLTNICIKLDEHGGKLDQQGRDLHEIRTRLLGNRDLKTEGLIDRVNLHHVALFGDHGGRVVGLVDSMRTLSRRQTWLLGTGSAAAGAMLLWLAQVIVRMG